MNKLTLLALVGLLTPAECMVITEEMVPDLGDHISKCPFGHDHFGPEKLGHQWQHHPQSQIGKGFTPIAKPTQKDIMIFFKQGHHDHHPGHFHHHEEKPHCPIKAFIERHMPWLKNFHPIHDLVEKFKELVHGVENKIHSFEEKHHECPFHKQWMRKKQQDMAKNSEHHDTPFYSEYLNEDGSPLADSNGVSTVVVDLFNMKCDFVEDSDENLINLIERGTKSYATCMDIGFDHTWHLLGHSFEDFSQKLCNKINKDQRIQGDFNLIGSGPTGVMARYVIEECELQGKQVRNLVTVGSPNMGLVSLPFCYQGWFCRILNHIVHRISLWKVAQDYLPLSELIYDPDHMEMFERKNNLMPQLNGQKKNDHGLGGLFKDKFSKINKAMFVKFDDDSIMYPKESAWFQQVDSSGKVVPLNESEYYQHDSFGLKTLVTEGRASFVTFEGDMHQTKMSDVMETIIPFLNQ